MNQVVVTGTLLVVLLGLLGLSTVGTAQSLQATTDSSLDPFGNQSVFSGVEPFDLDPALNPWAEYSITVGVDTTNTDRELTPLVADAVEYWNTEGTEYDRHDVHLEFAPNAANPDITIRFVDEIGSCGWVSDHYVAGCAPIIQPDKTVTQAVTADVEDHYTNESTRTTIVHELGHILGLEHGDDPNTYMQAQGNLTQLSMPAAHERELPWRSPDLRVHVDTSNVSGSAGTRTKQVKHALTYYNEGADGHVPANVSLDTTSLASQAEIEIVFTDDSLACGSRQYVSCIDQYGVILDDGDALNYYTDATIYVSTDVDSEMVGWHVGNSLGYGFGAQAPSDLPPPFQNAPYREDRIEWW